MQLQQCHIPRFRRLRLQKPHTSTTLHVRGEREDTGRPDILTTRRHSHTQTQGQHTKQPQPQPQQQQATTYESFAHHAQMNDAVTHGIDRGNFLANTDTILRGVVSLDDIAKHIACLCDELTLSPCHTTHMYMERWV